MARAASWVLAGALGMVGVVASVPGHAAGVRIGAVAPLGGTYRGDQLIITLADAGGRYTGTITFRGTTYQASAQPSGAGLAGEFTADGRSFAFTLMPRGDGHVFASGGREYAIERDGGGNPFGDEPAAEGNPFGDAPPAPEQRQAPRVFPGGGVHRDPGGLGFEHPAGWSVQRSDDAIIIQPPDVTINEFGGANEFYMLFEEDADGATRADDAELVESLQAVIDAQMPGARVTETPRPVPGLSDGSRMLSWELRLDNGSTVRARAYVRIVETRALVLLTLGEKRSMQRRDDTIAKLFSTVGLGEPTGAAPAGPLIEDNGQRVGFRAYRHPSGFTFHYPENWRVEVNEIGVMLVPPDQAIGPDGAKEVYLATAELAPGITRPDDPQVVAYVDQQMAMLLPFMRRADSAQPVSGARGPATVMTYEGRSPTGIDARARVYTTLHEGWGVLFMAMGEKPLLAKREPAFRSIFQSIGKEAPRLDPALIGRWTWSETYISGEFSGTTSRTLTLAGDGRAADSSRVTAGTGTTAADTGRGNPNLGSWYADPQRRVLIINWGDGSSEEWTYTVEASGMLLRTPDGSKQQAWRRSG